MFEYRCGIKLKNTKADAAVLKLLRKYFSDMSFAELRNKIQSHDYIYRTDMEQYSLDGKRKMAKLLQAFDKARIETELFEEKRDTPGAWQSRPMSRELLYNTIQSSKEIHRQTLIDVEQEVEGFVSPEAMADIEAEVDEEWENV